MKYSLTDRQAEALEFIRFYKAEKGTVPSYAQIAKKLGLVKSGAQRLVSGLVERGYILRGLPRKNQSYVLIENDNMEVARLRRCQQAADNFIRKQTAFRQSYNEGDATEDMQTEVQHAFEELKTRVGEAA